MVQALLVTSSFLPGRGGIESYLAELCSELAPNLAVLAPGSRDGKPLPGDLPYPVFAGPEPMLFPSRRVALAIERRAADLDTRKILFGTPWPLSLLAPRLSPALRYAVMVHGAEMLLPAAVPVLRGRLARALSGAEALFAVSDFTAGKIEDLLARARQPVPPIERLRVPVDTERFSPDLDAGSIRSRYDLTPSDRVILCFGRLVKRKGVHRLIEVLDEIDDKVGNVVLVVAGTGPEERRLRKLASTVRTRVVFTGRVREQDAPLVYAGADLFVLPVVDRYRGLETEGLGIVLLEAAACGKACVTGRSGGTPEAVLDGKTGYVIDATDRRRMIESVTELLKDRDRATEMGRAGRDHVVADNSFERPPAPLLEWLEQ